jgi:hypothetical protein
MNHKLILFYFQINKEKIENNRKIRIRNRSKLFKNNLIEILINKIDR